jgi:hypothetical protein
MPSVFPRVSGRLQRTLGDLGGVARWNDEEGDPLHGSDQVHGVGTLRAVAARADDGASTSIVGRPDPSPTW